MARRCLCLCWTPLSPDGNLLGIRWWRCIVTGIALPKLVIATMFEIPHFWHKSQWPQYLTYKNHLESADLQQALISSHIVPFTCTSELCRSGFYKVTSHRGRSVKDQRSNSVVEAGTAPKSVPLPIIISWKCHLNMYRTSQVILKLHFYFKRQINAGFHITSLVIKADISVTFAVTDLKTFII